MPNKKIPMRRCLALGESFEKNQLFRIVRTPEGEVKIDDTGKMNGRGAYLSKTKEAIILAKKKQLLDRALEVSVSDEIYDMLLEKINS